MPNILAIQYQPRPGHYWLTVQQVMQGENDRGEPEPLDSLARRAESLRQFHARHSPTVAWRIFQGGIPSGSGSPIPCTLYQGPRRDPLRCVPAAMNHHAELIPVHPFAEIPPRHYPTQLEHMLDEEYPGLICAYWSSLFSHAALTLAVMHQWRGGTTPVDQWLTDMVKAGHLTHQVAWLRQTYGRPLP